MASSRSELAVRADGGAALALPEGSERAIEYVNIGYIGSAMSATGWSAARHIELLAGFANDESLSNKDRREAAAEIRRITMRSLELGGFTTKMVRRAEMTLPADPGIPPRQLTEEQTQYTTQGAPGVLAALGALEHNEEGDSDGK